MTIQNKKTTVAKFLCIVILILLNSCGQPKNNSNKNKFTDNSQSTNYKIIKTEKLENSSKLIDTLSKTVNENTNSQSIIPENYIELKESPANGRKMERMILDLDNDKKADTSFIVQNETDFANYLLLIYLTSQDKIYRFKLINEEFNVFPVQLKAKKNVLEVGYFLEGTAAFGRFLKFRFDEKKNKIRLIGYDTGHRMEPGEYCDKSYDLINGIYIVKHQKSIPNNHVETFKGKEKIKEIYIDEINITTLNKLDNIGSEFELK